MAGASVNVRCLMEHPLMPIFREDDRRARRLVHTQLPGIRSAPPAQPLPTSRANRGEYLYIGRARCVSAARGQWRAPLIARERRLVMHRGRAAIDLSSFL